MWKWTIANGQEVELSVGDRVKVKTFDWMGEHEVSAKVYDTVMTSSSPYVVVYVEGVRREIPHYYILAKLAK